MQKSSVIRNFLEFSKHPCLAKSNEKAIYNLEILLKLSSTICFWNLIIQFNNNTNRTPSRYKELEQKETPNKNYDAGLPWWRSGWESACQCREHGFEPWSGKIPRAEEHLGPCATTTEPVRLEPMLRNKRGRDNERPAHRDEEWSPLAATRESPHTETKTQHSHK